MKTFNKTGFDPIWCINKTGADQINQIFSSEAGELRVRRTRGSIIVRKIGRPIFDKDGSENLNFGEKVWFRKIVNLA